jgi:hypothetical protein
MMTGNISSCDMPFWFWDVTVMMLGEKMLFESNQASVKVKTLWNSSNGRTIPPQGRVMYTTENDLGNTESQPPSPGGLYILQYS